MTKFTQTYPTDLKYTEWTLIADFFPNHHLGRPRKWELWQILNAILYVAEHGCKWRGLPKRFGNWHTIYTRMNRWAKSGVLDRAFAQLQLAQVVQIKIEAVSLDSTSIKVHCENRPSGNQISFASKLDPFHFPRAAAGFFACTSARKCSAGLLRGRSLRTTLP